MKPDQPKGFSKKTLLLIYGIFFVAGCWLALCAIFNEDNSPFVKTLGIFLFIALGLTVPRRWRQTE